MSWTQGRGFKMSLSFPTRPETSQLHWDQAPGMTTSPKAFYLGQDSALYESTTGVQCLRPQGQSFIVRSHHSMQQEIL